MAPDPKRSIKPWIPQVGINDPDTYPAYEYAPYPRMMTKLCTEADLKDWLENNSYTGDNGKVAYKGNRPRVGTAIPILDAARRPVVVHSAAEEAEFLKDNPPADGVAHVEVPALSSTTHVAEMAAKEKEIQALKAQLATASQPKKPGRPPKAAMPSNLTAA